MKFLFPDYIIICYNHNHIIKLVKFSLQQGEEDCCPCCHPHCVQPYQMCISLRRGFCWLWLRLVLRYISLHFTWQILDHERMCIMFDFKILFALKSYLLLYYNKWWNISIVPCHLHYSVPFKKIQHVNPIFSQIHVRVAYLFFEFELTLSILQNFKLGQFFTCKNMFYFKVKICTLAYGFG